ncbi:MAG: hypothetical protein NC337_04575 [Roseburia sp.]|nr:hypothetical protein [Roseburia sp.]
MYKGKKVIVSLTSYPKRIRIVCKVIRTLMKQTYAPDKIVLYLAEEQFDRRSIPEELNLLTGDIFEIHWCKVDLKAHKKYYYAFQEYHDAIVITVDDDFYYSQNMIKELLSMHEKFPNAVIARRTLQMLKTNEGTLEPFVRWTAGDFPCNVGQARMDLFATNGGGSLFVPELYKDEIFNVDNIVKYCLYTDDIWLKVMQVMNNIPVVTAKAFFTDRPIHETLTNGLYMEHNKNGNDDENLPCLIEAYPKYWGSYKKFFDCIFDSESLTFEEAQIQKKNVFSEYGCQLLCNLLDNKEIVIYGAGTIAKKLYKIMEQHHMKQLIKAFIVEDKENNSQEIGGIPVEEYKKYVDKGIPILVAVSEIYADTVSELLLTNGIERKRILRFDDFLLHLIRVCT